MNGIRSKEQYPPILYFGRSAAQWDTVQTRDVNKQVAGALDLDVRVSSIFRFSAGLRERNERQCVC